MHIGLKYTLQQGERMALGLQWTVWFEVFFMAELLQVLSTYFKIRKK